MYLFFPRLPSHPCAYLFLLQYSISSKTTHNSKFIYIYIYTKWNIISAPELQNGHLHSPIELTLCLNHLHSSRSGFPCSPGTLGGTLFHVLVSRKPLKWFPWRTRYSSTMINANLSLRDRKQFKDFKWQFSCFKNLKRHCQIQGPLW